MCRGICSLRLVRYWGSHSVFRVNKAVITFPKLVAPEPSHSPATRRSVVDTVSVSEMASSRPVRAWLVLKR
jgi:hypothetical protein